MDNYAEYIAELEEWSKKKLDGGERWDAVSMAMIMQGLAVGINNAGFAASSVAMMQAIHGITDQFSKQAAQDE